MISLSFNVAILCFLLAMFTHLIHTFLPRSKVSLLGQVLIFMGVCSLTAFISIRWIQAGYPPFTNTFEVLVLFSWGIALFYLILGLIYRIGLIGGMVSALALLVLASATLFEDEIRPLLPALQNSFWLTIHVILCLLGYSAFAISFIFALLYLLGSNRSTHRKIALYLICLLCTTFIILVPLVNLCIYSEIIKVEDIQDPRENFQIITIDIGPGLKLGRLAGLLWLMIGGLVLSVVTWFLIHALLSRAKLYRHLAERSNWFKAGIANTIRFGFSLFGLGIITGALWANKAWGSYWHWDPKETWSLITWLIYAIFLHLRFIKGWHGEGPAWIAIIGFLAVIFTFFGVNYLLTGVHSYV
jgi:cytochrome c-type biogenesis protein CcsB